MISVEQAFAILSTQMPRWTNSEVRLGELSSAPTVEDLRADRDYPPFHRVMMDGVAVSFETYESGRREFIIAGVCAAGQPQGELINSDQCLEVMTGAPLPTGADLIVQYEHLKIADGVARIVVEDERERFDSVHERGSDCARGDILVPAGVLLNGPHWGIAASIGYNKVAIGGRPRIQIISTGDELVEVEHLPLEHQIRRSNAHALRASLQLYGFGDIELAQLADNESVIRGHYQEASARFDLLIYSGGVSKGKFDYLPSVWKAMGVEEHFHGVSQRPGKPLWFGVDAKTSTAVVGLPGNPVSSLVCLHRYVLEHFGTGRAVYARLASPLKFSAPLTWFVPVKTHYESDGAFVATPLAIQNSGEFSALAGSDGFVELPLGGSPFAAGAAFRFFNWGRL